MYGYTRRESYTPRQTYFRKVQQQPLFPETLVRDRFTPQEQAILRELVRTGAANKELAYRIGVCEGTVKVYLSHVMTKIELLTGKPRMNRLQIVRWAESTGRFGPPPVRQSLSEGEPL
jgi:DNA-binding NarL/FixJ family response regulator